MQWAGRCNASGVYDDQEEGGGAAKTAPRQKASIPKATKLARLEAMMCQPSGATIAQLAKSLAWQPHSVRGAIAGSLRKKGIAVTSEKLADGQRIYRIA